MIGVALKTESFIELKDSLCELEELVAAAGGEVVASVTQVLPQYNPATLIGSGKVQEIAKLIHETQANLVVLSHSLSGIQQRNLVQAWSPLRVLDRNQIILDIFAQRARTKEGKLQVELAQMLDQMPRMVDAWMGSLSRQGGGIGTRGPGETALEIDRRRIRHRVKQIRKQLEQVRQHRAQHRSARRRARVPSFALIGYTNSGKSTLFNSLTHSDVLVVDQVFATLDPTTRQVRLPGHLQHEILPEQSHFNTTSTVLTDTVGFIQHIPTHLVEAFKATLEESAEADVLLHVVDLSNPRMARQIEVVERLIRELNWNDKPIITVYNKIDAAPFEKQFHAKSFPRVFVSGKTGEGLERLKRAMSEALDQLQNEVELFIPKEDEHLIFELGRDARILRREPASTGTMVCVRLSTRTLKKWSRYLLSTLEQEKIKDPTRETNRHLEQESDAKSASELDLELV